MGQTLTHGVYLPDEGERNCYSGLAANWQILDNSVGTIAANTAALAGKAPAVHTHVKADITDFPAYGTTAGTICEGNDSRLSDARTPVAHTHTKSDVTDLFNSANTWSQTNKFSVNISPSDITGIDSNTMAFTALRSVIFFNTTGSSNRQSYGTFLYSGYTVGSKPDSYGQLQLLRSTDKKGETNNGLIPDTSFTMWRVAPHYLLMDFMNAVRVTNDGTENSLKPVTDNATDLGTSTNKWKTLNGINPGALSLPDISDSYDVITTNWNTSYNQPNDLKINGADPSYPGWLFIRLDNCTAENDFLIVRYNSINQANLTFFGTFISASSSYVLCVPIQAGITTKVWVSKLPTYCKYYACLGAIK